MATVLITGGTGLVGTAVANLLTAKGYQVIILSRRSREGHGNISYAAWDPATRRIDVQAVQQADHIINLAGAGVADKRWSAKRKKEIVDSRVKSGELIVQTLRDHSNKVKTVINASGIGWYGDDAGRQKGKKTFTEDAPVDSAYLGETCRLWEESIAPVRELGKRLVIFRIGIVLSRDGGAYVEFRKPVRFGITAILGNGTQMISWVHIEDLARLFLHAIENGSVDGVYNAVSPQAISNKHFMMALASKVKGRFCIPFYVPSFLLKLMLGGMSVEVLKSATVSNTRISNTGFQFIYPSLAAALDNLEKR